MMMAFMGPMMFALGSMLMSMFAGFFDSSYWPMSTMWTDWFRFAN